jgi:hypothetical protein
LDTLEFCHEKICTVISQQPGLFKICEIGGICGFNRNLNLLLSQAGTYWSGRKLCEVLNEPPVLNDFVAERLERFPEFYGLAREQIDMVKLQYTKGGFGYADYSNNSGDRWFNFRW